MSREKITKDNVFRILEGLNKKHRKHTLRECYDLLRTETGREGLLPGYGYRGVIAEMQKHSGMSVGVITSEIYGRGKRKKKVS